LSAAGYREGDDTRGPNDQCFQASKPVKLHAEADSFPLCDSHQTFAVRGGFQPTHTLVEEQYYSS
jgi:hypothetical protein